MSETTYFGRVITAMVTPFTVEGQVNYALVEKLADLPTSLAKVLS
jgi:4-hydroxy-tetrahydrodipicolinate synthase